MLINHHNDNHVTEFESVITKFVLFLLVFFTLQYLNVERLYFFVVCCVTSISPKPKPDALSPFNQTSVVKSHPFGGSGGVESR